MFSPLSPFRNLPVQLERRQAFFLDGIRHAAEIADYSFNRLSKNLDALSHANQNKEDPPEIYSPYFLDAWAFVDSIYRLIGLWKLQPHAETLPEEYSASNIEQIFSSIIAVRNISDHIAQRADQVISSKSTSLGILSWITLVEDDPPAFATYTIRPGIVGQEIHTQLHSPIGEVRGISRSMSITLRAGPHSSDLSNAYFAFIDLMNYAEDSLTQNLSNHAGLHSNGADMLISAMLSSKAKNSI